MMVFPILSPIFLPLGIFPLNSRLIKVSGVAPTIAPGCAILNGGAVIQIIDYKYPSLFQDLTPTICFAIKFE